MKKLFIVLGASSIGGHRLICIYMYLYSGTEGGRLRCWYPVHFWQVLGEMSHPCNGWCSGWKLTENKTKTEPNIPLIEIFHQPPEKYWCNRNYSVGDQGREHNLLINEQLCLIIKLLFSRQPFHKTTQLEAIWPKGHTLESNLGGWLHRRKNF